MRLFNSFKSAFGLRFFAFGLLPFTFCLFTFDLPGQDSTSLSQLKIGEWQQHLPWQRGRWVTQSTDKIWFATEWGFVELNKSDRAPRFFSKTEGLSEIGMGAIKFDPKTETLLLTYSNSNIDLWRNGVVTNVPFIKTNTSILGDKHIYDLFLQDNAAWISCGFGIVKLRLDKDEFEFTTFTNTPVYGLTELGGFFFMATAEGIFRAATTGVNLADFSAWQRLGPADGFPAVYKCKAIVNFKNSLHFELNGDLFRLSATGQPELVFDADARFFLKFLTAEGSGLIAGFDCKNGDDCPWPGGPLVFLSENGELKTLSNCINHPLYAIEDEQKKIWHADDWDEFRVVDLSGGCETFKFNSPYTQRSQDVVFVEKKTFMAAGTITPQPGFDYNNDGFYAYENGRWTRFFKGNQPLLQPLEINDFSRLAWDETRKKLWVGSYFGGLSRFDPETGLIDAVFDKNNSALQAAGGDPNRTLISGLEFDSKGNLWIANYRGPNPVVVLKTDGSFQTFSTPISSGECLYMGLDGNDYKWFSAGTTGGIYVFDSGADLESNTDDQSRVITTSNSVLPSNRVNCFAADLDGDMWVGTDKGVCSFQCGSNIFEATCTGSKIIINTNSANSYLLANAEVRVIAIDGANRKWIGTTNGLFVFSPDGHTEIEHFTAENSPLYSNTVLNVAIHPTSGDIWISTLNGLQTLRGEATEGKKNHSPMAFAFPNPVRPDYDGPIAITGLARDSNVKITDVNGQLVFETTALGGQAIWDGRDYQGRRAASGVYLVFGTGTEVFDQPEAGVVAKIIIVN